VGIEQRTTEVATNAKILKAYPEAFEPVAAALAWSRRPWRPHTL
jgi:hypothetical protein